MGLNYDIFFTSSDKTRLKSILPGCMYMLNVVVCVRVRAESLVYTEFFLFKHVQIYTII